MDRCSRGPGRLAGALALVVALAGPLAGCTSGSGDRPAPSGSTSASPTAPDPAAAVAAAVSEGSHATATAAYALDDVTIPGLRSAVEVEGHVVGPVGAAGAVPLVVLLHGYQASCWRAEDGSSTTDWPCPPDHEPIPHWMGFTYLQQRLASQGYLTVSLAANGVNVLATQMGDDAGAEARAALVNHHLGAWAAGEIPDVEQWPDVDTSSVMLVGHSRGGEGVDRAVADTPADATWTVRGEVLIGPTGFEIPDRSTVPVVAMTGYCDGDTGPGPGQRYVDRAADPAVLRSSIVVEGANHNFFNSEWVPGASSVPGGYDDAYDEGGEVDALCDPEGPARLSPDEQQDVARRVLGLSAAALLRGDAAAADVLDGRVAVPVAADEVVRVSAAGRGRTTLRNDRDFTGGGTGGMVVVECDGISETEEADDCGRFTGEGGSVHWPGAYRDPVVEQYLELTWQSPGGSAVLDLAEPIDLSDSAGVEARVAVTPEGPPVGFDVVVTDSAGQSATLAAAGLLTPFPDSDRMPSRRWGQRLFAPIAGAGGENAGTAGVGSVDLSSIEAIALVARTGPGHAWIIDVSALPSSVPQE